MSLTRPALLAAALALAACRTAAPAAPPPPDLHASPPARPAPSWGYEGAEGPAAWADLDEAWSACRLGTRQSPIALATGGDLPSRALAVQPDYRAVEVTVRDAGHALQADVPPGLRLAAADAGWELRQVHAHAPSEHTLDGRALPLELHLVHANARGGLAVLAILVEAGAPSAALAPLAAAAPPSAGAPGGRAALDLPALVPAGRAAFHYLGSLTTPPCTEGVSWFVLAAPIHASPEQIEALGGLHSGNRRPVQPLNGRRVERWGG